MFLAKSTRTTTGQRYTLFSVENPMAAVPAVALNGMKLGTTSQAYLESKPVKDTKALISELCRQFYNLGWVGGTGGSITIKVHEDSIPKPHQLVVMSPSGVQKERMVPEDMYVLSSDGTILTAPSPKPYPHKPPKCSDCGPLFLKAECYHYLFDAAIKLHQLGLDWTTPTHGPIQNTEGLLGGSLKAKTDANHEIEPLRRCIVLDIEGTTTPISFVSEVLFPYARDNVGSHLSATYDSAETQDDIKLLHTQVRLFFRCFD